MDLIIYCILLAIIGAVRLGRTATVSDDVGIVDMGSTTTVDCSLPVGSNLALIKEPNAYTIILVQLGLM